MSVEIVSRCKLVKVWGVHQVSEIATLGDIYCGIVAGTVETGSPFQMLASTSEKCWSALLLKLMHANYSSC